MKKFLTLLLVAAATALLLMNRNPAADEEEHDRDEEPHSPRQKLNKSINSLTGIITLIIYLLISFVTGAWYITWLIFPIAGALNQLINACMDLKEAK